MQYEMGRIFSTHEGTKRFTNILVGKSEERSDYLDDVQVDGRIVGH
jgi:hypothetical protein